LGVCAMQCRAQWRQCKRVCEINEGGYYCHLDCDDDYTYCLLGCPDHDSDSDQVLNGVDNCPSVYNPSQADCDNDGQGDACDTSTCPNVDDDGDGVPNVADNCPFNANSNQADCDGDGQGDVCDAINANYQPDGPLLTCHTSAFGITTIDVTHSAERAFIDVSSCGSPGFYTTYQQQSGTCTGLSAEDCCLNELSNSINALGDSPSLWCGAFLNYNQCH